MILQFDRINRIVTVPSPETSVTVQEVYDQSRDIEDRSDYMDMDDIVYAEGKTDLGSGQFIVISLFMVNSWRIAFEARPGPDLVVCQVVGGNMVGRVGDPASTAQHPIAPTTFTHATIAQASTGLAIVSDALQADVDEIKQDARVAARGMKITKKSTDAEGGVPGTLEVYDPLDDSLVGTGDIYEDHVDDGAPSTVGYRDRGINRQEKIS